MPMTLIHPVKNRVRTGFTLVETMVYAFLFSIILAGLSILLRTQAQIDSKMQRLDTLNTIRLSSFKLSRWLKFGTHVLFPPMSSDSDKWFNKLLFADMSHEKKLIYIDDQNRLRMQSETGALETLAENVIEFGTKRLDESLIVFRIKVREPRGDKFFMISNSIQFRNNDLEVIQSEP